MIVIVDYGMGNLESVRNALAAIGCRSEISADASALKNCTALVLPGVGAFGDAMKNLRATGLDRILSEQVLSRRKPFLGICLGLQLLAEKGFEHGENAGLGWIKGEVVRLSETTSENPILRIPHIGWNDVHLSPSSPLSQGLKASSAFYFVHSYCFNVENADVVSGWCEYGLRFPAIIESDNISATQFHPEKSHKDGLKLLRNWAAKNCLC
jgi:glutamine amidotransferase